jgi:crossover junction endodeoxyribonuclease RuvC
MKILGIDPGTARVGWAILRSINTKIDQVIYGCITTDKNTDITDRLVIIHQEILSLIKKNHPDCVSLEDLYFSTNVKTAISVGEARGVILMTAGICHVPVISYSPLTVKQTITGYGQADKKQMQTMVTKILKLPQVPQPDDTADAIAIALTHVYTKKSYINN